MGMSVLISSHDLKGFRKFLRFRKYDEGRKDPLSWNNGSDERTIYKITGCIWRIKKRDFQRTSGSDHVSNLGSVYTVILEGYGEPIHEALKQAGAIVVEEIPLSLEEVFVYSNR